METSLDKAQIGSNWVIVKVKGEKSIKRRLMDMGLTPGTEIFVRRFAPLGDPMEIRVRGSELTLRKADALNIFIKAVAEN
ncbi:MAG: FeoA family protein [Candidatus Izemoplasmatales bacterium]|mgnify:CR=1 FL=1|jgi:ferrous iron transport protein A